VVSVVTVAVGYLPTREGGAAPERAVTEALETDCPVVAVKA